MLAQSLILLCIATFYVTDATLTWTGPSTLSLAEDQATSTTVETYTVTGGTGTVTYSLVAGSPPFQIDSTTGALSLSTALDYEAVTTHSIAVKAVDSDNTPVSATTTITVTVTDVNEAAPVFAPSSYSKCLTDGTAAGSSVITVTATDTDTADTISYTFTGGNTGTSFDIPTPLSGLIQVSTGVTLSTATASYDLVIAATDSGTSAKSATVTVSITVAAACNNAQTLTWSGPSTLSLPEDQATLATVGTYTVSGGTGTVTYTVVAGNPPFQVDSSTGALSLSTALDYETATSHTVKVKAVDSATPTALSGTATISVTVTDVTNENAPVFASSSYSKCLLDGTAAGTTVITVTAADADTGDTISYTITGGNTGTFNIPTASSGLIQVSTGVTLSTTTASYDLEVTATDSGTSAKSATVTVSITVAAECSSSATTTIVSVLLLPVAVFVTLF